VLRWKILGRLIATVTPGDLPQTKTKLASFYVRLRFHHINRITLQLYVHTYSISCGIRASSDATRCSQQLSEYVGLFNPICKHMASLFSCSTSDLPKPETDLAEWTNKSKARQRQVDADEETQQKRLEDETVSARSQSQ
jgi:hypothetical protein